MRTYKQRAEKTSGARGTQYGKRVDGVTKRSSKKRTVLIIDDDEDFLEETATMLEDDGYRTVTARTPLTALSVLAEQVPDVILLDWRMEGNGAAFIKELNSGIKRTHIPVIVVSADREADIVDEINDTKVNRFIEKPVNPLDLIDAIETAAKER
jgi:two-component system phosphate regulon response regulator PhoB